MQPKIDDKTAGFVALIDRALEITKGRLAHRESGGSDSAPVGALENLVDALQYYRNTAIEGKLEPSEGIVTTGFLREVADWGESGESELLQAARAIESYYLDNMK